ncbi:hypothetical protein Ccrd_006884, partial [Cynara cardunculus var. scolymus]
MGNDEKQELSGIKLKNGILIGKKANKTTPSKLGFHNSSSLLRNFPMNNSVSARKIGANLWEVQPQFNFSKDHADHGGAAANLSHHRRRRHRSHDIERFEDSDRLDEKQPPDSDPQPVTPFIKAATPIGYTVKTSTHLLKILNRIWNLEEQHSLNVALIKTLKRELGISRAQITTLIEERKRDRQEMDEWKKSINDRKKKAIESTRDELLDIKSSLMRERKARILLESLCDEFANGIRDYEQKVRFLQQNRGKKDQLVSENEPDRLILHVSEAWLDERVQMKCDFSEKTSISDNLCCEIETFLEAKKKQSRGSGVEPDELLENTEPSLQLVPRMTDRSLGVAEPSSQLMSRMERLQDHGGAEPSMPRRAGRGSDATEPSSKSITRGRDRGSGVAEPRAREGAKSNTLMAKLLEA